MDEYVREALKEDLSELTEPVIKVLQAAKWTQRMLSNPDMEQRLVVALKEPFENRALYPMISDDIALSLARAAIPIAASIIDAKITVDAFLETVCLPLNYSREIGSKATTRHANAAIPKRVLVWEDFVASALNYRFDLIESVASVSKPQLPASIRAANEAAVQAHFNNQVSYRFDELFEEIGLNYRFGAHQNAGGCKGQPDIVLVSDNEIRFFVEMKTRWTLDNLIETSLVEQWESDNNLKSVVSQVMGYMCHNKLKFGAVSSFERTWFLQRTSDDLLISPPIRFSGSRDTGSPTLYRALAFCLSCVLSNHYEEFDSSDTSSYEITNTESSSSSSQKRPRDGDNEDSAAVKRPRIRTRSQTRQTEKQAYFAGTTIPKGFHLGLLKEQIGEGFCGSVFACCFRGQEIAVKICDVYNNKEGVIAMQKEVEIYKRLRDLQGKLVPRLCFYGEAWGFYIIATSRIFGVHPSKSGLDSQVCDNLLKEALAALEDRGVRHGDPKDDNIIITPERKLVLIDFSHSSVKSNRKRKM